MPPRRLPALDTQLLSRILAELGQIGGKLLAVEQIATNQSIPRALEGVAAIRCDLHDIRDSVTAALRGGGTEAREA